MTNTTEPSTSLVMVKASSNVIITKLQDSINRLEDLDQYRLPYKFQTEHDISTRMQLISTLRNLQLSVAQATELISLIESELKSH